MFERECDLYEVKSDENQENKNETKLGRALLKILYDDDVYGARIIAVKINESNGETSEDESYLCNHIIAVQTNLGMISHKQSLITIFGLKHEIKSFIKIFDIFHEKISMAFGFWSILGIKFLILKQKHIKND